MEAFPLRFPFQLEVTHMMLHESPQERAALHTAKTEMADTLILFTPGDPRNNFGSSPNILDTKKCG